MMYSDFDTLPCLVEYDSLTAGAWEAWEEELLQVIVNTNKTTTARDTIISSYQPCFCAKSEASCLMPVSANVWTTADQVGVTFFFHSLSIWMRRSARVGQSALMDSSFGILIPRWRPKGIQSMMS